MKHFVLTIIAATACVALASCGPRDSHDEHDDDDHAAETSAAQEDHGDHDHEGEAEGGGYIEGKGMSLPNESLEAMGVAFETAERRKIAPAVSVEAQVYRSAGEPSRPAGESHGNAYAAAFLSPAAIVSVRPGDAAVLSGLTGKFDGSVWKIEPASRDALANEEVIIEVPDAAASLKVGDFLSGNIMRTSSGEDVVTVPASAILETATGKFVFVKNDEFLLRVPVETGAASDDRVEITKGIRDDATVAVHPVQTLYLIELRATKGGGHSH